MPDFSREKETMTEGSGLLEKAGDFIRSEKMISRGDLVLAAFSGGPDSLALLHVLNRLKGPLGFDLAAAHLDHGLRGEESRREAREARALCQSWGIPVVLGTWSGKSGGLSPEEAAREARLAFLEETRVSLGAAVIATGHHRDDQAETVLIRLLNGSGLTGLAGIRPVRGPFIRPFLEVGRREILAYCREWDLKPQQDSSNESDLYLRNRLRHQVVPLLEKENPRFSQAVSRMTALLRQEEDFLDRLARLALADLRRDPEDPQVYPGAAVTGQRPEGKDHRQENGLREDSKKESSPWGLSLAGLQELDPVLARRAIRLWLGKETDFAGVERIFNLALQGRTGAVAQAAGGQQVRRGYRTLELESAAGSLAEKSKEPAVGCLLLPFDPKAARALEEGEFCPEKFPELYALFRQEAAQKGAGEAGEVYFCPWKSSGERPILRRRRPGDWILLPAGRKKLKDLFIDRRIPREKRDSLSLLAWGDQILWIPGVARGRKGSLPEQPDCLLAYYC